MTEQMYLRSEKLRAHQLRVLEMLKYFDSLCKRHQIHYFIVGGTALGAVRHKGFIPWDDDADVAVPRPDYERLEVIMLSEKHEEFKFEGAENHSFPYPPFAFISTHEPVNAAGKKKASLDIFPLDGVPNSKVLRLVQEIAANCYHLAVFRQPPKNRTGIAAFTVRVALLVTPNFVFDIFGVIAKKVMLFWPYETSDCIANIFGMARYKKEIMPKSFLGNAKKLEFEGLSLPAPEKPEEYLTHLYRDYMRLPPMAQRKPMHGDFE